MTVSPKRRSLLLAAACTPFIGSAAATPDTGRDAVFTRDLEKLEAASGGRLGVAAVNLDGGKQLGYRANERFAVCSTLKVLLVGAILNANVGDEGLLGRRIEYAQKDLVSHSPVTGKHVQGGMTIGELCAAAIQYSDNTATNLLLKQLGGPAAVTAYARAIGDEAFRLDRFETALNSAIPGDLRDTSTPQAMMRSLRTLSVGDALPPAQRKLLVDWLLGNTTGATRIRAGVPPDWQVGDKTGSGDYGTTNDVAVLWPPGKPPIVLAVYFTQPQQDATSRSDVIAAAAKVVAAAFA